MTGFWILTATLILQRSQTERSCRMGQTLHSPLLHTVPSTRRRPGKLREGGLVLHTSPGPLQRYHWLCSLPTPSNKGQQCSPFRSEGKGSLLVRKLCYDVSPHQRGCWTDLLGKALFLAYDVLEFSALLLWHSSLDRLFLYS